MQFSITAKLIFAFLGLTLLVLIATLVLTSWRFEQDFLGYINTREQTRLEAVAAALAREYETAGNDWASMTPSRFDNLLRSTFPDAAERPRRPRGPRGEPPGPPTALFDPSGRQIAGAQLDAAGANLIRMPIIVGGDAVGELRSQLRRRVSAPQDQAFSRRQLQTKWAIGLVSLLLAAAISVVLARGLLAPIRRMITTVSRLSDGDYSARLAERRNDELGQLMSNLDHLGLTLEKDRSARRRWLADISHELKTPLTILAGEMQALRDGVRRFDAEQLDSLDQEVQRLQVLIDDLYELSVSDMGGLRYDMATFNLSETLESAVGAARNRVRDSGLEITMQAAENVRVKGDSHRIDQLLNNLFENSMAYTDGPGRIEVTLARGNGTVIIEIHDTKPGATPDECEQLFEPLFRREASRNRRTGGAGLGLAICRNIIEAHRGTIVAAPSPLGGLCIRIEMPAASEIKT